MVGTQIDWRSKSGIRRYACTAATGGYYGSTMAATNWKRSQGSSRDSITRGRRRPLVYLTLGMAFTESEAYFAGAPLLYRALVHLHRSRRFFLWEKNNLHAIFSSMLHAGHIISVNLHVTCIALKMGRLNAYNAECATCVWLCMRTCTWMSRFCKILM